MTPEISFVSHNDSLVKYYSFRLHSNYIKIGNIFRHWHTYYCQTYIDWGCTVRSKVQAIWSLLKILKLWWSLASPECKSLTVLIKSSQVSVCIYAVERKFQCSKPYLGVLILSVVRTFYKNSVSNCIVRFIIKLLFIVAI